MNLYGCKALLGLCSYIAKVFVKLDVISILSWFSCLIRDCAWWLWIVYSNDVDLTLCWHGCMDIRSCINIYICLYIHSNNMVILCIIVYIHNRQNKLLKLHWSMLLVPPSNTKINAVITHVKVVDSCLLMQLWSS